jgi:glycolate dehydrogenase FAD-binding subunit
MATLTPRGIEEVQAAIEEALARRESLEVIGTGSKRAIGRPSEATDILDLSLIAGINSYEPEELVLIAKAATTIAEISEALSARKQMLAFEPPDFSQLLCTGSGSIGGAFASNLSGPRRIKSGAARDFILGFSGVNGRGEAFKAGGRVVKNVTGYDLPKLLCGSWGTLAVLGEVTLKVMPLPETEVSVGVSGLSHEEAVKAMIAGLQSAADVSGAAYVPAPLNGSPTHQTMLRIEGIEASVKARAKLLQDLLKSHNALFVLDETSSMAFWRGVRDVSPLASLVGEYIWRLSVPAAGSAQVMAQIGRAIDVIYYCDWGGGLIWLAVSPEPKAHAKTIRRAISAFGGHATLIRAPANVRGSVPVFEPQPKALAELTRRVKLSFDPKRVLNRSRMYEGV